jgi:hypothetical protein
MRAGSPKAGHRVAVPASSDLTALWRCILRCRVPALALLLQCIPNLEFTACPISGGLDGAPWVFDRCTPLHRSASVSPKVRSVSVSMRPKPGHDREERQCSVGKDEYNILIRLGSTYGWRLAADGGVCTAAVGKSIGNEQLDSHPRCIHVFLSSRASPGCKQVRALGDVDAASSPASGMRLYRARAVVFLSRSAAHRLVA